MVLFSNEGARIFEIACLLGANVASQFTPDVNQFEQVHYLTNDFFAYESCRRRSSLS